MEATAAEQPARDFRSQTEAQTAVGAGSVSINAKDAAESSESSEHVQEDAAEVAGVMEGMVAGVVAANKLGTVENGGSDSIDSADTETRNEAAGDAGNGEESTMSNVALTEEVMTEATATETLMAQSTVMAEGIVVETVVSKETVEMTKKVASEETVAATKEVAVEEVATEDCVMQTTTTGEVTSLAKNATEETGTLEAVVSEAEVEGILGEEAAFEEVAVEKAIVEEAALEETAVDGAAVEEMVTKEVSADETAAKGVAVEQASTDETAMEEVAHIEEATPATAVVEEDGTNETASEPAMTNDAMAEATVAEEVVAEGAIAKPSDESSTREEALVELSVSTDAATDVSLVEKSNEEMETLSLLTKKTTIESTTTEKVVVEKTVIEEETSETVVLDPLSASTETSIETHESSAVAVTTESMPVATDDTLSREAAKVIADRLADGIIADSIAFVNEAAVAEVQVFHATESRAEVLGDAVVVVTEDTTASEEELKSSSVSVEDQIAGSLEVTADVPSDVIPSEEIALDAGATQSTTATSDEAVVKEADELTATAVENEGEYDGNDALSGAAAEAETTSKKTEVVTAKQTLLESIAEDADKVMTEPKASGTPELVAVSLGNEPKESEEVLVSAHTVSSDEEGWRSDDNDSVDGEDTGSAKKSRSFRSPMRSMISRFANKVSSSMPKKKKIGAHRTESAAKLELVSPSPVKGAVAKLESHAEEKLETHRTESAAQLDLDGSSPVKHIVHRFESPQHSSLDGLKIRTVRTFFDEKERSIHVGEEKEKYNSALKPAVDSEATPKKSRPMNTKTTTVTEGDATSGSPSPVGSPAHTTAPAGVSVEATGTIDTTTVTPVKNIVSRFEKKPEQSLDNLSFRTVRTFFPTNVEPSIRVGAEKQKYDAMTEQQKAEVRRQEEEKIIKKKKATESVVVEANATTVTAAVSSEEAHAVHVRDIAHQLEARSSLTRDLAPVSLSRSSSNASERVDTTPVRITRSSSGAYEPVDTAPVRLGRSTSGSSDRSSVSGVAAAPPSLSRSASSSSDRPPRFVPRSQSDASSQHDETHAVGDEFHVKDVAQRFEARLAPAPLSVRRSSGAEVTLGAAHTQLRRTSEPPMKQPLSVPAISTSREEKEQEEIFHVKDIASRFEAKQQSPANASLSRQSSGVDSAASANATAAPRFRRESSQSSASSAPATPKQTQVAGNAVVESTPSANVRDIAHRFETNRAQSVETPAYRTVETFFKEVEEPSVRVRAEKAKLEALERQKEQEAKLAWAKTQRAAQEAAEAAKAETLDWFLMPAATNPALVRLHAVLADRDPVTALALFPRPEVAAAETDGDLDVPFIPMDLPPFA